jgi:hypothetical protein
VNRYQLLAAEIFGYSYANYQDHLGIGNIRYENLMPDTARKLERAVRDNWHVERVARELQADPAEAREALRSFEKAREVVDAENSAESFRCAVRQVVERALAEGLRDENSVEKLVKQICYRAADLGFLLERENEPLSRYSRHLR